jgi:hypothetical protein
MISEPRDWERELASVLGDAADAVQPGGEAARPRDWEQVLDNIVGGAAEAVFESSDEEVEAEILSFGEDPDAVAEEVRSTLLDAVDRFERTSRAARAPKRHAPSSTRGRWQPS